MGVLAAAAAPPHPAEARVETPTPPTAPERALAPTGLAGGSTDRSSGVLVRLGTVFDVLPSSNSALEFSESDSSSPAVYDVYAAFPKLYVHC